MDPGQVLAPGCDCLRLEIDRCDVGDAGLAIENSRGRPAREACAGFPCQDIRFRRLLKLHMGKAGIVAEPLFPAQDIGGPRHLGLGKGIEGMGRRYQRNLFDDIHDRTQSRQMA